MARRVLVSTVLLGSVLAGCSSTKSSGPVVPDTAVASSTAQATTTVSADPCSPSHLAAELQSPLVELVNGLCDGSWALISLAAGPALVRDLDGTWAFAVTTPTALCRDDLISRGVPTEMVDEFTWSCETFALASTNLTQAGNSGPFQAGTEGGRVGALQRELFRQGLLAEVDVDGLFGPISRRAVLDFQFAHGLPLTAIVDDAMLRVLGMLPSERAPAAQEIVISETHLADTALGEDATSLIAYLTDQLGPADSEWTEPPDPENYRDWSVTSISWSGLLLVLTPEPDGSLDLCEFSYVAIPELGIVTSTGARLGDSLDRWLELYPGAAVMYDELWISRDEYGDPMVGMSTGLADDGSDTPTSIFVGPIDGCWGP